MTLFSSRPPFNDDLSRRRRESWIGTRPVTLTKDGLQVNGHRQGRFGGVAVNAESLARMAGLPKSVRGFFNDFRPPYHAELPDSEWERLGWIIDRPKRNPTNPILVEARIRGDFADMLRYLQLGTFFPHAPADQREHARRVLVRLAGLAKEQS